MLYSQPQALLSPASAYEPDTNGNSVESVEYQNTEDEDFSPETSVYTELASIYKVTIPKTIVLNGKTKDANYLVKVEGDIAGYEQINVVPDETFTLRAANKADETTTVNQDKTVWTVHDFDTDANGTISADGITAGKWRGTFNFNINLEDGEKVAGDIIIPPVDEWSSETVGQDITLKAGETGYPEITLNDNDILADCTVTSSDESIAKIVNQNIKALKVGTSKIAIFYGNKKYTFNVNVIENPDMKVHIHTTGKTVTENGVDPTCTEDGYYYEVVYCATCEKELERNKKNYSST